MTRAEMVEAMARAARVQDIIPLDGDNACNPGVRIEDYLNYSAADAIELGVTLTEKDKEGKPRFHWYSDIRCDEYEDVDIALLTPLMEAALSAIEKAGMVVVESAPLDDLAVRAARWKHNGPRAWVNTPLAELRAIEAGRLKP